MLLYVDATVMTQVHFSYNSYLIRKPLGNFTRSILERWEVKWIASVLDPEHAQEEAVHAQHYAPPNEDSQLLPFRV